MRFTFTIKIPEKRGSHENTHVDFLKAASKQVEETLDYATSREGRRLMNKLKEKAGCDETELIQECWEATDEMMGKKSSAVVGEALTGSAPAKKPSPFAKVAKAAKPDKPEASDDELEETEDDIDQEAEKEAEEEVPAPKLPAKFPAKKFPFKKKSAAPAAAAIETEEEEDSAPEQVELLPEIEAIEEGVAEEEAEGEDTAPPPLTPAGPPSSPPSRLGGVKRPAKGMTGFAKKGSPFKKMPKFKKP